MRGPITTEKRGYRNPYVPITSFYIYNLFGFLPDHSIRSFRFSALRKDHGNFRALSQLADHIHSSAQESDSVLYNGKTQTGSPDLSGMALIHPVEAFEHSADIFPRYADTGILHHDPHILFFLFYVNAHGSVVSVVFDAVIAEVIENLLQDRPYSAAVNLFPFDEEMHILLIGHVFQIASQFF